jgi:hypothetical protein
MVPPPPAADRTAPGTLVPEEEPLREPETVAGVVAPPGIDEAPRPAVATRLAPAAAPSRPMSPVGARCAPLLARLQLGETPTHEERQRLRSECAPRP